MSTIAYVTVLATFISGILWMVGEVMKKPVLRVISGPTFAILLAIDVAAATTLHISFSNALLHSAATKQFVASVVSTIDRGDIESAHSELRRYDQESIETYEGGLFLKQLREATRRLKTSGEGSRESQRSRQVVPSTVESDAE
jgi:hypothetical protein